MLFPRLTQEPRFVDALLLNHGSWLAATVATGLVAGFIAGLLGVGGGIVLVPVLDLALAAFGVDASVRIKIAVASSLATIVATSAVSARTHSQHDAVDFELVRTWGPVVFVGVVVGTLIASRVDGDVLLGVFAVTASVVAANMLFRADSHALFGGFPSYSVKLVLGFVVGLVSAMMGIGGGTLSVPILTAFGTDIRRAVGTASTLGFVIAIPGTIGYVVAGWNADLLPPFSLGYVNLIAVIAIVPLSTLTAPWGAKVAHKIPRRYLAYGFGVFLIATACRMFWSIFSS